MIPPTHFAAPPPDGEVPTGIPALPHAGRDTLSHLTPSGSHQSVPVDQPVMVGGGVIARTELAQVAPIGVSRNGSEFAPITMIFIPVHAVGGSQ